MNFDRSKYQLAIRYEYSRGVWTKKNQLLYKDIPPGEFNHFTAVKNHILRKEGKLPDCKWIDMNITTMLVGLNEKSY